MKRAHGSLVMMGALMWANGLHNPYHLGGTESGDGSKADYITPAGSWAIELLPSWGPRRGHEIKSSCITPAILGAHMRVNGLHKPCRLQHP